MHTIGPLTRNKSRFNASITLGAALAVLATTAGLAAAQDRKRVSKPNYAQTERYSSRYLRQFVYDSSVRPNWIGKTDKFWYSYRTSQGTTYYRVDPKHATKERLFDHGKMAALLSEMLRKPLDSERLPLTRVEIEDDGSAIKFVVGELQYQYELEKESLAKLGKAPRRTSSRRFGQTEQRQRRQEEQKKDDDKKDENKNKKDGDKEKGDDKKDKDQKEDKQTKKQKTSQDDKDKQSDKSDGDQKTDTEEDKSDAGKDDKAKGNARRNRQNRKRRKQQQKKQSETKEQQKQKDGDTEKQLDKKKDGKQKDVKKDDQKKDGKDTCLLYTSDAADE